MNLWSKKTVCLTIFVIASCSHIERRSDSKLFLETIEYSEDYTSKHLLRQIYRSGDYFWLHKEQATFQKMEQVAKDNGLRSKEFQFQRLASGFSADERTIHAQTDILITDRMISLIKSLRFGYVNPKDVDLSWRRLSKSEIPLNEYLTVLKSESVISLIDDYGPKNPAYERLKNRLRDEELSEDPDVELIEKIKVNMERWRWLDTELGEPYVIVNIATGRLSLLSEKNGVIQSKVLVGTSFRQTPVFSSKITKVVLNPTWTVPPTIFKEDLWPKIKSQSYNPEDYDMKIYIKKGRGLKKITYPQMLQLDDTLSEKIVLIQLPGSKNPLGKVKLYFPNPFGVYLHDTNNPGLFDEENVAVSSGCIRVKAILKLANYLAENYSEPDDLAEIESVLERGATKEILLSTPIPIHMVYFTFWIDQNGKSFSVRDIYSRDSKLMEALKRD